ncbi:hypothetical protein FB565_002227 [Actinoplanes lutulentus]|uniref:Uncharacterized protein n=1 Tax=Actinoplanes lutulentus TaxID=1287878 RepID=A0A327ZF59_9ACTN|nr:hypothetical protein [Actinoplanes lutulentus]MBB2942514.1 hypothetical protein [Actinoplanes lutulentus]RAK38095.1 hypothetical protein B0I29_10541 [Actinoplanes lutulentus]
MSERPHPGGDLPASGALSPADLLTGTPHELARRAAKSTGADPRTAGPGTMRLLIIFQVLLAIRFDHDPSPVDLDALVARARLADLGITDEERAQGLALLAFLAGDPPPPAFRIEPALVVIAALAAQLMREIGAETHEVTEIVDEVIEESGTELAEMSHSLAAAWKPE